MMTDKLQAILNEKDQVKLLEDNKEILLTGITEEQYDSLLKSVKESIMEQVKMTDLQRSLVLDMITTRLDDELMTGEELALKELRKSLIDMGPIVVTLQTSIDRLNKVCATYDDCDIEVEILQENGISLRKVILSGPRGLSWLVEEYPDNAMIITTYQDDDVVDRFEF